MTPIRRHGNAAKTLAALSAALLCFGCAAVPAENRVPAASAPTDTVSKAESSTPADTAQKTESSTSNTSAASEISSDNPFAGETLASAVLTHGDPYDFTADADLESFFTACGFAADAPFYQYADPEGRPQLTLWYDPETHMGAGIRFSYYEGETSRHGFGFEALAADTEAAFWQRWQEDFTAPPAIPSDIELENYKEYPEYDNAGRLIAFSSECTLDGEPEGVYNVSYEYAPSGQLLHRSFGRNHKFFETTGSSVESFFDDEGRLLYERSYITHGSLDFYCLYAEGQKEPAFCLYLDENMGCYMPQFAQLTPADHLS